jgi:hypothetical protein
LIVKQRSEYLLKPEKGYRHYLEDTDTATFKV